jgi:hypothetical protein
MNFSFHVLCAAKIIGGDAARMRNEISKVPCAMNCWLIEKRYLEFNRGQLILHEYVARGGLEYSEGCRKLNFFSAWFSPGIPVIKDWQVFKSDHQSVT